MRTTSDTDGKRAHRRPGHGWQRWQRWLLYPLIAVSAYLLVALAKAVPDAASCPLHPATTTTALPVD